MTTITYTLAALAGALFASVIQAAAIWSLGR